MRLRRLPPEGATPTDRLNRVHGGRRLGRGLRPPASRRGYLDLPGSFRSRTVSNSAFQSWPPLRSTRRT